MKGAERRDPLVLSRDSSILSILSSSKDEGRRNPVSKHKGSCDYCGLEFSGPGYSPDGESRFCCYGCYLVSRIVAAKGEEGLASWIIIRLGIGAFLSMNVMMISLVLYSIIPGDFGQSAISALRWAMLILSTPAIVILGGPFIRCGLTDLIKLRLGTDVLIATGSIAAYAVSTAHVIASRGAVYFDTATMLLLIVTLGRLLEASAKSGTSRAIHDMASLTPDTARVVRGETETEMPAAELRIGDVMIVRPGERVPADGRIVTGSCTVEEAAFTGEACPRACFAGDRVFGGSVDRDGPITVEAEAVGGDTLAARIEEMVLRARRGKAPVERLAERISAVFVPAVWTVSAATAFYWAAVRHDPAEAGMCALAVLVVACPCALGLATPMATCLAIGSAAKRGVLVRSGEILERLHGIRRVFFDKTGTLTRGSLSVVLVRAAHGATESEIMQWAAPLEASSGHIVGEAIAARAAGCFGRLFDPKHQAENASVVPGLGVTGDVTIGDEMRRVTVGSLALLSKDHGLPPELSSSDRDECLSVAYVGWNGRIQGVIGLSDEPRPEAREVIAALAARGIGTAVVSGDRDGPTRGLAGELGIAEVFSEVMPEDKAALAAKARGTITAFVGDGINDAPALAAADVGITIGSGTDLARESSDVTLLGDDLTRIPELMELSRVTYRIIRQNLAFSFGYNIGAIVLAAAGFVHPLIAALAMFASSLCVISNSMRIRRLFDRSQDGV